MNEPGNPLQGLLGDLLKMIGGSQGGGTPWLDAARALAQSVATDGEPEVNVDPIERISLEAVVRAAELHVTEITGLPIGSSGQSATLVPTSRGSWALHMLDAWAPFLGKFANPPAPAGTGEVETGGIDGIGGIGGTSGTSGIGGIGGIGGIDDTLAFLEGSHELSDSDDTQNLEQLFTMFATTMGPVIMGMQFGSAIGHLAHQALGQYVLPIPVSGKGDILVIPQNVRRYADDWSVPVDQAQLWVCSHELASHAVLSIPHIAKTIDQYFQDLASESTQAQKSLLERLTSETADLSSLQSLLSDPESLVTDLVSPDQQRKSAELIAVTSAISAYVDHVTGLVAGSMTGSASMLSEAWYRFRTTDATSIRTAGALFGLDLGREQVDRGAAFVRGVVERAGDAGLARLWAGQTNLPTPAELDAPGLWLERIDLPQDS